MILRTTAVLLYLLVASAFAIAQEAPAVIWCSSPVQPGETVLVHGRQFGSRPVVEPTPGQSPDGEQKRTVEPRRVSDSALLFVLPNDWQPGGVFGLRAYWSRVADNRFCRGKIVGWNGFSGQQLIVENNHLGGANGTSFYALPEGSENSK